MCTTEEQNKASGEDLLNNRQAANDSVAEQFADFFNPELLKERLDSELPAASFNFERPTKRPDPEAREKLKQCYLEEARLLCPTVSLDSPEDQRLGMLYRKIKRIVKVLNNFNRPWESGLGEIEKACLHYLITQEITRTDRKKIIEEFSVWFDFLVTAAFHRSFIGQLVQDYCHQLRDLEHFFGCKASGMKEGE